MHDFLDPSIIQSLIPIVGMLIPIVAIIGGIVQHRHSETERHETIRELARSGQPIPPELLRGKRGRDEEQNVPPARTARRELRRGVILISIGAGICCAIYLIEPSTWLWGVGLIPFFLGVGFMVLWRLDRD